MDDVLEWQTICIAIFAKHAQNNLPLLRRKQYINNMKSLRKYRMFKLSKYLKLRVLHHSMAFIVYFTLLFIVWYTRPFEIRKMRCKKYKNGGYADRTQKSMSTVDKLKCHKRDCFTKRSLTSSPPTASFKYILQILTINLQYRGKLNNLYYGISEKCEYYTNSY